MAKNKQLTSDAVRPLYAVVGAGDLVVKYARTAANDVQTRFAQADLEPKAIRDQTQTMVVTRVNETVATATGVYDELASRGKDLVARVRR